MNSSLINVKPLFGGKDDINGICTLLELGNDCKILLDCGLPVNSYDANNIKQNIIDLPDKLIEILPKIDLIIISHADNDHIGGLPLLLGKKYSKNRFGLPIPVLCTLPVLKFGNMVLYDYYLNKSMEGKANDSKQTKLLSYDLDDVDNAFDYCFIVKYCQQVSLDKIISYVYRNDLDNPNYKRLISINSINKIFFTAYSSGRSIGGAMWNIRYGHIDIVYAMDIQLKRDNILNGANIDHFLVSKPSVMILESGSLASTIKKKERDDFSKIFSTVLQTLRNGGNVIIPCESIVKTIEYLYVFSKYWLDNKLGLYQLVFLSHMSHNIIEYARSQLEWMNDNISTNFYNGKSNPFELSFIKLYTNISDIEKNNFQKPKIIFSTDNNLSYGLSKDLLLRYGGNPINKFIFLDYSYDNTIANEIRKQLTSPPIIITIDRPVRVDLQGDELIEYNIEKDRLQRIKDEARQRKLLENELALLDADRDEHIVELADDIDNNQVQQTKRIKLQTIQINRYIEPMYPMFTNQYTNYKTDEYGISNDDLQFVDIAPSYLLGKRQQITQKILPTTTIGSTTGQSNDITNQTSIPYKLISISSKIQFTCEFIDLTQYNGRIDSKAIKGLVSKILPNKIIYLRSYNNSNDLLQFTTNKGIDCYIPSNNETITFNININKLKIQINQSFLPTNIRSINPFTTTISKTVDRIAENTSTLCKLTGHVVESNDVGIDGIRVVKLIDEINSNVNVINNNDINIDMDEINDIIVDINDNITTNLESNVPSKPDSNLSNYNIDQLSLVDTLTTAPIHTVSIGEIMLSNVKILLETQYNVLVDFQIGSSGGMLICNSQVIIMKDNDNDFVIEGPPIPLYYTIRRALYQQLAFI